MSDSRSRALSSDLDFGITTVILWLVKTAVSLPDDLFERAETEAAKRGMTRSGFYAEAIESYISSRSSFFLDMQDAIDRGEFTDEPDEFADMRGHALRSISE